MEPVPYNEVLDFFKAIPLDNSLFISGAVL